MKNPLAKIREERGLTISEMSILGDCSFISIQRIESGSSRKIPKSILNAVTNLGYNPDNFKEDYAKWKEFKLEELKSKVGK